MSWDQLLLDWRDDWSTMAGVLSKNVSLFLLYCVLLFVFFCLIY